VGCAKYSSLQLEGVRPRFESALRPRLADAEIYIVSAAYEPKTTRPSVRLSGGLRVSKVSWRREDGCT
jgi:hypothetical protein